MEADTLELLRAGLDEMKRDVDGLGSVITLVREAEEVERAR